MIAPLNSLALVRYGRIPEVARCQFPGDLSLDRGQQVVVQTQRGLQVGTVLELVRRRPQDDAESVLFEVLRPATDDDRNAARVNESRLSQQFADWENRLVEWKLDLQLIDLEITLDAETLILYVLNDRGPECTKLALQAAAAGFGVIEVQPVSVDGPVKPSSGGGCGSGGGGCGCSH
jgi:cell fate regulator YaaT (PSP1 superfamily)